MRYLFQEELLALLAVVLNREHWLIMVVMYWHGLRVTEAISLTGANLQSGYLVVKRLKGSKTTQQRFVKHSNPLLNEYDALMELSKTKKKDEKLFPDVRTRFRFTYLLQVYGKRAGLARYKCCTKIFKHSIGRHSIHKAGIMNVKEQLGHKKISSTAAYLEVDQTDAEKAVTEALGATL